MLGWVSVVCMNGILVKNSIISWRIFRRKLGNTGQMYRISQRDNTNNINRKSKHYYYTFRPGGSGRLNLNLNSMNINSPHTQFDTQLQSQQQQQLTCFITNRNKIRQIAIAVTSIITIIATMNKLCNDKSATNFRTITLVLALMMGFFLLLMLIISRFIVWRYEDHLLFGFECKHSHKFHWVLCGRLRIDPGIIFTKSLLFLLFVIWFANNPLHWVAIQIAAVLQMVLFVNLTFLRKIHVMKSPNNSNNNNNISNDDSRLGNNHNHKASSSTFGIDKKSHNRVCCGHFGKWQLLQKSYILTFTTTKFGLLLISLQTIYFCVVCNGSNGGTTHDGKRSSHALLFIPWLWYYSVCVISIHQVMKQFRSNFAVKFTQMQSIHDLFGPTSIEAPIAIAIAIADLLNINTSNVGSNNIGNIITNTTPISVDGRVTQNHTPVNNNNNNNLHLSANKESNSDRATVKFVGTMIDLDLLMTAHYFNISFLLKV